MGEGALVSASAPSIPKIIKVTAAWAKVAERQLASPARDRATLQARWCAIYVAHLLHPAASFGRLAQHFGLSGASGARWCLAAALERFGAPDAGQAALLRGVCRELGCWPLPAREGPPGLGRARLIQRIKLAERELGKMRRQLANLDAGAAA